MRKKSSIISHLVDHEKIELDKHIEEIVLQNQSSSGGGGGGGGTDLATTDDRYLKLDQSTPQTVTGGTPNLNLDNASAPTGQADGYLAVVDETLWYFAGGNRYKITATLDNPVAATDRYASLWFLFGNVHD